MAVHTGRHQAVQEALRGLGIDPNLTQKVVIEIGAGEPVTVHVRQVGDERLLGVIKAIDGDLAVIRGEAPAQPANEGKE